ncbi:hypothetical protein ACVWZZ_001442 [Bradyrhizobium sp. LM6.10]|jgi:hypothetical protein
MSVFLALLVLTSWVMFIWISDPDGFREANGLFTLVIPNLDSIDAKKILLLEATELVRASSG